MKNRLLRFDFFSLLAGIALLFTSFGSHAGNPGPVPINRTTNPSSVRSSDDHLNQMRSNQNTGTVDPKDVLKAKEQIFGLSSKSAPAMDLNWISLGPNNVAGRARGILYDKRDSTGLTIYVGAVSGGIWRSTNGGLTWHEMNSGNSEVMRSYLPYTDS